MHIAPCGFSISRTQDDLPVLEALSGWRQMRAVRTGGVALADGNLYFNRSGTSIVETVEIIADILHGPRAVSEQGGRVWQRYHPGEFAVSSTHPVDVFSDEAIYRPTRSRV
jgi:iron complex transport system substrate-binding protein